MPGGRPTKYCKEMADKICRLVATNTFGLKKLCDLNDDIPEKSTINCWRAEHPEFSAQYAQAKLKQADLLAEEILDIADDATNDWMETIDAENQSLAWKVNQEHIQRSRLRIDTRKWLAAKLLPRQYGEHAKSDDKSDSASLLEKIITGEIQVKND